MIRVLVVDDSAPVREVLSRGLDSASDIQVVGTAADAYEARDQIRIHRPDVITVDLQMPRMSGLTFLEHLMHRFPIPVVIVSSVSPQHSGNAMRALELGAVDVVEKPAGASELPDFIHRLREAVRAAAASRVSPILPATSDGVPVGKSSLESDRVVLIGASTGGLRAIETVLRGLPLGGPAVLVVQHLPASFLPSFASRLAARTGHPVRLARDGELVRRGEVLIAEAGRHMTVAEGSSGPKVRLKIGAPHLHHIPAVDILFRSAVDSLGGDAFGVLLTGMGTDGAEGLLSLRRAGATTIAEAEESCVVYGMPREAARLGAAEHVVPLQDIGPLIAAEAARSSKPSLAASTA
jgi:two-component system chemotaxis response regulator CheB